MTVIFKDEQLALLSKKYNVAQFISYSPDLQLRFAVTSYAREASRRYGSAVREIQSLLEHTPSVNIRTFRGLDSKSTDFVYGLTDADEAAERVASFGRLGLFTIVNETIDIHDGGISGVSVGGITEFSPDATPRVVELDDDGIARLPTALAFSILNKAYGTAIAIPDMPGLRVEFSVHPQRVGHRQEHSLCWEVAEVADTHLSIKGSWPNNFSRMLGDKVFGLLLADSLDLPVPRCLVIPRRIPPFGFGRATGTGDYWLRTSPRSPKAGYFTTQRGWTDPFRLLEREDPTAEVASVISQEGVASEYSGAAATRRGQDPLIEGVRGYGDRFMLGADASELPRRIYADVNSLLVQVQEAVSDATIEWAHDGRRAWLLQLHNRSLSSSAEGVLNPGDADHWLEFDPETGLEALRAAVIRASESGYGIVVTRRVGITSHVGDVIREAGVPARLA